MLTTDQLNQRVLLETDVDYCRSLIAIAPTTHSRVVDKPLPEAGGDPKADPAVGPVPPVEGAERPGDRGGCRA